MDEYDDSNNCHLHWRIENPFLPWRRFNAIFYHGSGSPFLTEWKASIVPISEKESFDKEFLFYLECPPRTVRLETILIPVEKLSIEISFNERRLVKREMSDYSFSKENLYAYQYPAIALLFPTETTDCLEINIGMTFRNQNIIEERRELVFFPRDLTELSRDLARLQRGRFYTDLNLTSKDPVSNFSVHSDILRARWRNFFKKTIGPTVKTDISERVLSDILFYIYSGTSKIIRSLDDESAKHELFQVIDRYRLHHLYKTFIKDDSEQERLTIQEGKKAEIEYLFYDFSKGSPIKEAKYKWNVFPSNIVFEFELDLQLFLSHDPPSFSYTLQSRSTRRIFAQLTFEFLERLESGYNLEVVHAKEFEFEPYGTLKSGHLHFEDSEALNGYRKSLNLEPNLIEARHSIRCVLSLGIGKTTERLFTPDGENLYLFQDEMESLNVLSDHMSEMLNQIHNQDFIVICPSEKANCGEESHLLHKAIFAARVPNYWAVLEGVEEGSEIPNIARCTLSSEAFRYVIQYIYTGKVFRIPEILLHEIENFANKGQLHSLKTLVDYVKKQCW